jgi:3-hydroxyisobutyrate dehydrogenase-like beta-hydroxyacid dehydrogenase
VAAPVFGRPNVAEEGRLWIVVAGAENAVAKARPLLEPLLARHLRCGHGAAAGARRQARRQLPHQRMMVLAERVVCLRGGAGNRSGDFFEAVNSALFQSPFYAAYSKVMLHPPEHPGATIELGEKDLRLLREAAASRGTRSAWPICWPSLCEASAAGLARDWAVGSTACHSRTQTRS